MKRYLKNSIIVAILALIIVLAQYSSGMLIERYYQQFSSQTSEELKFKIKLSAFKRNFFTSTAKLELYIPATNNASKPHIIPIQQKIIHGPFVVDLNYKKLPFSIALGHIHNELEPQYQAQLKEWFHQEQPFSIITKLNFLGSGTTLFSCIPIKQSTKTTFEVTWDGIEGKIFHSLDLRTLKGEIIAPKLSLKDAGFQLEITNIKSKFNTKENNNLSIGNSTLHADTLNYQENEGSLFTLTDLNINSTLNNVGYNSQKLNYLLTISVKNSKILKQEFTENTYRLSAQSITTDFFNILHANYDKKSALLADLLRQLLNSETNIYISMPKHFSQSLIAFCNFQLYKNSIIGKIDPRPQEQILTEISNSMQAKFDDLVKLKIFLDNEEDLYKLIIAFDKTGKILLNGEQLENPLQALQELGQPKQQPAEKENAETINGQDESVKGDPTNSNEQDTVKNANTEQESTISEPESSNNQESENISEPESSNNQESENISKPESSNNQESENISEPESSNSQKSTLLQK